MAAGGSSEDTKDALWKSSMLESELSLSYDKTILTQCIRRTVCYGQIPIFYDNISTVLS